MKTIAFLGSPRREGNTELLLNQALEEVKNSGSDLTLFRLAEMRIFPCQNCGGCDETGRCIIGDDGMAEIYDAIRSADRIILASPIFFSGLTAQTKAMIDRCQCFWCEKYLLKRSIAAGPFGRKGLLLLVGGMKKEIGRKGLECAGTTAKAFFRTISVPEHKALGYTGIDTKGEILNHPDALLEAREAGRQLMRKDDR
jgi:NAD(P)H-dependent FMN reductase